MHSGRTLLRIVLPAVLTCCFAINTTPAFAEDDDVFVIVNAPPGVESIPKATLRAIFTMRLLSWPDGTPIKVFSLRDREALHQQFCKQVLRVYPFVLRDQWDRLLFTGSGTPPAFADSPEELAARVAETPGSIGYTNIRVTPPARVLHITAVPLHSGTGFNMQANSR